MTSDTDVASDAYVDKWRRRIAEAIASPEGQAFLWELGAALDAIPHKRLIKERLTNKAGDCCAIGALCKARGLDTGEMDDNGIECVAEQLNAPWPLVAEIVDANDGHCTTPEGRWQRMRRWVDRHITQGNDQ